MAKLKSKWHTIPWNTEQYLKEMQESPDKKMQIIALFARIKNYNFDNYAQIQFFITRNQAVAKRLQCFSLDKIEKVLCYLMESADYKIALETIEKYILEDIDSLKGEDPILVLKNGERIYNIKRLQELEQQHEICFRKNKLNQR